MSEEVVVDCHECGTDVHVFVGERGIESGGHHSTILTALDEFVEDDANTVNELIDPERIPDGHGAIVFSVCENCCENC